MSEESLSKIVLEPKRPLICLEVNPPRGSAVDHILTRLSGQTEGIDFFNVPDCALAHMRFASLPFGVILKQKLGIEPLVNLACRDRNLMALQSDLLAAWSMGIRSVVALTGDSMSAGDCPERKGVFEVNSVGLLNAIKTLNSGIDLSGHELKGSPSYVSGVVVNPNVKNIASELKRLQRKREAGARYALSQPVFDENQSVSFFKEAKAIGLPVFMGLLPLKSAKGVEAISKVPGIKVPDVLKEKAVREGDKDLSDFFIEKCMLLAKANREYVCGYHVVAGPTPTLAMRLCRELVSRFL